MIKISGLIIWWRSLGRKLVAMDLMLREELEEDILPMVYLALESNMSQVLLFLFHFIVCLVLFFCVWIFLCNFDWLFSSDLHLSLFGGFLLFWIFFFFLFMGKWKFICLRFKWPLCLWFLPSLTFSQMRCGDVKSIISCHNMGKQEV